MGKKARLGLYLDDEELKKQVKIAAASRGVSVTTYCADAIKERLKKEGWISVEEIERRKAVLDRMDELSKQIGPIGARASELVKEGRRR